MDSERENDESFEGNLEKIIQRTREMEYRLAKIIYDHRTTEENEGEDYR